MADILAAFLQGQQGGQQFRADRDRRSLADLLGKARASSGAAREGYIAQSYSLDPGTAMQAEQQFGQLDEAQGKQFAQVAQVFTRAMTPEQRAQAWPGIRAELAKRIPQAQYPDQWDESLLPQAEQLAGMIAQQFGGQQSQAPASVQELEYLLANPEARELDMARRQAGWQPKVLQTDQGYAAFDPRTRGVQPLEYGGGGLLDAVIQQESGGNPNAVSPKGARGLMQIMPQTGQDPGFGVEPLRDGSPQENVRMGRDYLVAMMERYGDERLALAAYNAGPGSVDQALQKAGGDPQRALAMLPQETQQYVPAVQQRAGGQVRPPQKSSETELEKRVGMARQMGASDEEVRRMVVGGDSARDAQRISTGDMTKARQKLTQLSTARQQLQSVRENFARLKDTYSAGPGGTMIPTPEGQAFDRAVRNLAPLITAVTRVPGVGSMSDYEAKLQEASLPSRGTYEAVTEQQIADLERLLDSVEAGYKDLMGGAQQPADTGSGDIDSLLGKYGIR